MTQAARSGVQNIAEGSQASATSKKMELKLTGVARSSLEELRLDYEDFLRQRHLPQWSRDDLRRAALIARRPASGDDVAAWVREIHDGARAKHGRSGLSGQDGQSAPSIKSTASTKSIQPAPPTYAETAANAALVLTAVARSLLDRRLAAQATAFERDGGFTERLYRRRRERRRRAEGG
jgi:four helix bundle suffix protein